MGRADRGAARLMHLVRGHRFGRVGVAPAWRVAALPRPVRPPQRATL